MEDVSCALTRIRVPRTLAGVPQEDAPLRRHAARHSPETSLAGTLGGVGL